jgi:selenium-binding protein 1
MRINYRRVSSVAAAAIMSIAAIASYADETCNSPYMSGLIKGQEDFVHVWTLGVPGMGDGSDKLVTVSANPSAKTYGKVVDKISVGGRGEAHPSTICRRRAATRVRTHFMRCPAAC